VRMRRVVSQVPAPEGDGDLGHAHRRAGMPELACCTASIASARMALAISASRLALVWGAGAAVSGTRWVSRLDIVEACAGAPRRETAGRAFDFKRRLEGAQAATRVQGRAMHAARLHCAPMSLSPAARPDPGRRPRRAHAPDHRRLPQALLEVRGKALIEWHLEALPRPACAGS
jgi:hypothetical protein